MSVIAVPSRNKGKLIEETDEFQGLWINVGVLREPEVKGDAPTFVRLPRGVAVSDLKTRKIYDNMDPEFAASANLMNQLILEIQKAALALKEGESRPINLEVQLYRRQEESAIAATPDENKDLAAALFGTGTDG